MRARFALAAAIVLMTSSAAPVGMGAKAADDPLDVTSGHDQSRDQRAAVRIRSLFGFASDEATIRASLEDSLEYPDNRYGTPLTGSEAAEVTRRVAVQESLEAAARLVASVPTNAGFYIDQARGGVPVFLFTVDDSTVVGALREVLPATAFLVEPAGFSETDLLHVQGAIERDRDALVADGIILVSTGIDTPANRVAVGVDSDTSVAAKVLRDRYGQALYVRSDAASHADACTYKNCWLPQKAKGGIHIYRVVADYPCTSGFVARRPGTSIYAILTAGHCIEINGGSGKTFKHGTATVYTVGTSKYETWASGANADAGIIDLASGSVPTPKNTFHVKESGTHLVRSLNSITSHQGQGVGMYVCRSGLGSARSDCGYVVLKNVTRPSCVGTDCRNIDYQFEVDFDSTGGDSGGPVYVNNTGYGIHVHSDPDDAQNPHGWYSSLDFARSEYYAYSGGVTYNFCLVSDCSVGWPY